MSIFDPRSTKSVFERSIMARTTLRCLLFIILIFLAAVSSFSLSSPAVAQDTVTVPAGTGLLVKIETLLMTGEAGSGDPFTGVLEKPVAVDGKTVFTRGTRVHGQVVVAVDVGNISGRPAMGLHLVEIDGASGTVSIKTRSQGFVGTTQGTVNRIAAGTVVGEAGPGIAVDSSGRVTVKPGALVEFQLADPVEVE
jgi:hypothetical protein